MMNEEQLRRTSVIAGAGAFILALLGCLVVAEPGAALLIALGTGVALGGGAYAAGSISRLSHPPEPPARPRPPRVDRTVPAAGPEPADTGLLAGPPDEGTAHLSPDDVVRAADLHQTIRLDEGNAEYVLPEFSPEELFRDREGIDEQFLKAGIGLEDSATPSDNTSKAPNAEGESS
jgi:hypothetical protein